MKKIIIALFTLFSVNVTAQDRIYLANGIYGSKNKVEDNFIFEQNKTTILCGCNLNDVCSASNVTGLDVISADAFGSQSRLQNGSVSIYGSSVLIAQLSASSGVPFLMIKDVSTGYSSVFKPTTLSNHQELYSPDETGIVVTHTTKDAISVYNSGTNDTFVTVGSFFQFYSGLHSYVEGGIDRSGATPMGYLGVKSENNDYHAYWEALPLTAERIQKSPDEDGIFLMNKGSFVSTSVSSVTTYTVTHGLGYTPRQVIITPTNLLFGNNYRYVSAKTSTTFTVTFSASTTGTITFDWTGIK